MQTVKTEAFKPRASSLSKIMGEIGLTDVQTKKLNELQARHDGEGRPLTEKMEQEFQKLVDKRDNPVLPTGCISYLKEWYSEQKYGRSPDIQSKYTIKGHLCEDEAISVIEGRCGEFGEIMEKNDTQYENEWLTGEPDVVSNIIYDAKCPWDGRTFLESLTSPHNENYVWQMRAYMFLTELEAARVCYVLLDTPAEANYGEEVLFSATPIEERFFSFTVLRDKEIEEAVRERIVLCREWLKNYNREVEGLLR